MAGVPWYMLRVACAVVATLAILVPAPAADACACHFLACGGGGTRQFLAPTLPPPEPGERTHRFWEAEVRLVGQRLVLDRVTVRAVPTPIVVREGDGAFSVLTRSGESTRSSLSFDFPARDAREGAGRDRALLRTTVRVPYDPDADTLVFDGPAGATVVWELAPALDSAEAMLVRRLARELVRER